MRRALSVAAISAAILMSALALSGAASMADPSNTDGPSARHESGTGSAAPARMRVRIAVTKDAKMGYNLRVITRGFTWAPQHASGKHIAGEGHAHLYIDGQKITRLYGEWYYLGNLAPGRHSVKVALNGNDHSDYKHGDKVVQAIATVIVPTMATGS